jgi:DMSO/TMAO reductase YedYZ heme-binding membrane subunit
MQFLITLVIVVAICVGLSKQIKRYPVVFYGLAVALVAAALVLFTMPSTDVLLRPFRSVMQKGQAAFAFYVVVMFIGVLGDGSWLSKRLMPVRGELSIIGSLLICAHIVPYLSNYAQMALRLSTLKPNIALAIVISFVLLALVLLLTVTSFKLIKKSMSSKAWKRIQSFAYVMFGLVYVHVLGYLLVAAMQGAQVATLTVITYSVVFVAYLVLRVYRAVVNRRAGSV